MTKANLILRRRIPTIAMLVVVIVFSLTPSGHALESQFLASLRIEKPQPVSINVPGVTTPNANGQLKDLIAAMVSDGASPVLDEMDQPAASREAASQVAGFTVKLPGVRPEPPMLVVLGAHSSRMIINYPQLQTILATGRSNVQLPQSLKGGVVTIKIPRAIRAQYGNCPAPVANTLQNQIQGPPPPSTDNADCIVLIESPMGAADVPLELDIRRLVDIAVELSGMSPNQAQAFEKALDWKAMLGLSLPRFMRSFESVEVNGAVGMLLNTGGRRGPAYELIWSKDGMVYSLTGYGSSGDAVPLAKSLS